MAEYRILAPCTYAHDGIVTQHRAAGAFVELDEDVAAELGDAVQLIVRPEPGDEAPIEVPTGAPAVVLDSVGQPADVPADLTGSVLGDVVDTPALDDDVTTAAVEPEADEVAKGRRGRGKTDGGNG